MNDELSLSDGFNLRLARLEDDLFLRALFVSTRPELSFLPLPQTQLEQIVLQQYDWQQKSYIDQYPNAENLIIEHQGKVVGKIMLDNSGVAIHIIDFIIAPERRNQGIGGTVLCALKAYVKNKEFFLRLNVERQNINAKRLYLQHGFFVSQISDRHEQLVWSSCD